jgi:hypothetical protein
MIATRQLAKARTHDLVAIEDLNRRGMSVEIEQTANCPATTADRFLNPLMTAGFIMLAPWLEARHQVELHRDYFLAPAVAAFKVGKLDRLRPQFNVSRGKEVFVEDRHISLTHHWPA